MCQSVTLQTAIMTQVKKFAQQGQSFSVHDITRELRASVNAGELEIPEVEVSGESFRFNIEHVKVKGLFDELWRNGVFAPDFKLDRSFTGVFWQYTPSSVAPSGSTTPAFIPTQVTTSVPVPVPTAVSVTSNGDASSRIATYLNNCRAKNFRPTLKKVQSAIKRKDEPVGLTCAEIKPLVVALGYTVVDDQDESASAAQVIV